MGDRRGKKRLVVTDLRGQRLLLRSGLIGLAAVVAIVAWLATRGDDSGGGRVAARAEPVVRIVSLAGLVAAAAKLDQPIYWAGSLPGTELELEELTEGGVRVIYLPAGEEAGADSSTALTIGSYPLGDPEAALREFAARPGAIVRHSEDGTEVVSSREQPTSVYFVGPDKAVQVEVYDPSARRAMRLALSGHVRPVAGAKR
jgi:hypothetical protein